MINYQLSQKFELLGKCNFNHLTVSLTDQIQNQNLNSVWIKDFSMLTTIYVHCQHTDNNRLRNLPQWKHREKWG